VRSRILESANLDRGDRFGEGEDDMEAGHREQVGLAGFQPERTGQRLALGTVAVAAANGKFPLSCLMGKFGNGELAGSSWSISAVF